MSTRDFLAVAEPHELRKPHLQPTSDIVRYQLNPTITSTNPVRRLIWASWTILLIIYSNAATW